MADVAAQSIEEFADRIIYRYPGGRYEQSPTTWASLITPGLKTLVNTQTSRSYVVPQIGINAKFFKIEWLINTFMVLNASGGGGLRVLKCDFARYATPSPALNYDGKSLQTEFYDKKTENIYASPNLRAINISNIQVEPIGSLSDYTASGISGFSASIDWDTSGSTNYLAAILQPVVTLYKK